MDSVEAAKSFSNMNRRDRRKFFKLAKLKKKNVSWDEFNQPIPKQESLKKY